MIRRLLLWWRNITEQPVLNLTLDPCQDKLNRIQTKVNEIKEILDEP